MTCQTITLKLPGSLYRTVRQMAQVSRQPTETVLQDSLAAVLPPGECYTASGHELRLFP
ncbi:MAG: hypothetical protein WAV79_03700 [Anaerolineae bacterium]